MTYRYTFNAYGVMGLIGEFSFDYETDNPNQDYPNSKRIKKEMCKVYPEAINYINIKMIKIG